jgi:V/A-type H+-transporting ATPase subunit E
MGNSTKTDNFLQAIKKYADEQRNAMRNEVEQLKEEKIREAEEKGKNDSEKYISDMLEAKKNEETGKIAKLMQDGQRKLFLERSEMTESVFSKTEEKLIKFTNTKEYSERLISSTKAIAALFGSENCTIFIKENDKKFAEKLSALFDGKAEISVDKSIKIGGIKGYCPALSIVADETLDSKLAEQRQWFIENSGLSVL